MRGKKNRHGTGNILKRGAHAEMMEVFGEQLEKK